MTLRALVADDEPHGRRAVREQLARATGFTVVAECGDGASALAALRGGGIDVAFLDVRMPERSGLDVARALGAAAPLLVFVTAFDEHAVEAFEHCAVDYVLKPIDPARFQRTLERVRERLRADAGRPDRLARLLAELQPGAAAGRRVALEAPGRTVFVAAADFVWAAAEGNYVEVHVGAGEPFRLRTTLQQLEQTLQPCDVVRIHRAYLIGLQHVREVRSTDGGHTTTVRLRDGTDLPVGRTFRCALVQRLGRPPQ